MSDVVAGSRLAEPAILKMLKAAVTEARDRNAPSGVAIVDASGLLRAFVLMDGAVPLAQEVVPKKARTAAYTGSATGAMEPALAARIAAAATDFADLPGGLPIVVNGALVGGIAAGGVSAEDDVAIARAGLQGLTIENEI